MHHVSVVAKEKTADIDANILMAAQAFADDRFEQRRSLNKKSGAGTHQNRTTWNIYIYDDELQSNLCFP